MDITGFVNLLGQICISPKMQLGCSIGRSTVQKFPYPGHIPLYGLSSFGLPVGHRLHIHTQNLSEILLVKLHIHSFFPDLVAYSLRIDRIADGQHGWFGQSQTVFRDKQGIGLRRGVKCARTPVDSLTFAGVCVI